MTLVKTHNYVEHVGNGVAKEFSYNFFIPDSQSVQVWMFKLGSQVLLSPGQYSITGVGVNEQGGVVTYPLGSAAPIGANTRLRIQRKTELKQEVQLSNQTRYNAEAVGRLADRGMSGMQDLAERLRRAPQVGSLDDVLYPMEGPGAGRVLQWGEGGAIINGPQVNDILYQNTLGMLSEGFWKQDFETLLDDDTFTYGTPDAEQLKVLPGYYILTRTGYIYIVRDSAATAGVGANNYQFITQGGVKLSPVSTDGVLPCGAFNVKVDGVTDDTEATLDYIAYCEAQFLNMKFRRGNSILTDTIRFNSTPGYVPGCDVDGNGINWIWQGPPGKFAVVFDSITGSGANRRGGNKFKGWNLNASYFPRPSDYTFTGSKTFTPPALAGSSYLGQIGNSSSQLESVNVYRTTVSVPGAIPGEGFATATMTPNDDFVELTAVITDVDEATVYFNNYDFRIRSLPEITLNVTAVNEATHGVAIGGPGAEVEGMVTGFTGVSAIIGSTAQAPYNTSARCVVSGVMSPARNRCYYAEVKLIIAAAHGWPCIVPDRSNENELQIITNPLNGWPKASAPNQGSPTEDFSARTELIIAGVDNNIQGTSLESVPQGRKLRLRGNCGGTVADKVYSEVNTGWNGPAPFPRVVAGPATSSNKIDFRLPTAPNTSDAVLDMGVGNKLFAPVSYWLNGNGYQEPQGGAKNLLLNGDFMSGLAHWDTTGTTGTVSYPSGTGLYGGKRIRYTLANQRLMLQQSLIDELGLNLDWMKKREFAASVFVLTNVAGVSVEVNSKINQISVGSEVWEWLVTPMRIEETDTDVMFRVDTNVNVTGYVEICHCSMVPGSDPVPIFPDTEVEV